MFKVSYFMEVLPIIASKVNVTFELTIAATIFALIVGVIVAIIGYYKVPALYQFTRVYVAYFLPKTERGDKLTEELNDVIQEMLDDGTVAKITEKWMYSDMTKLIQK